MNQLLKHQVDLMDMFLRHPGSLSYDDFVVSCHQLQVRMTHLLSTVATYQNLIQILAKNHRLTPKGCYLLNATKHIRDLVFESDNILSYPSILFQLESDIEQLRLLLK